MGAWQRTGSEAGSVGRAGRAEGGPWDSPPPPPVLAATCLGQSFPHRPPGFSPCAASQQPGPGAVGSPSQVQSPAETRAPQGYLTALSPPVPCLHLASPKPRTPTLPSMAAGKVSASNDPGRAGQVQVERGVCPTAGFRLRPGKRGARAGEGKRWGPVGTDRKSLLPWEKPPGKAYTGQARLQAHPLPSLPGWLCAPFLLPSSPGSHRNHLGNCKAV